ncbi:MAG: PAS domain-containing protein [Deltaproteobacteria bacterium]|nr:PAS domain-containing protein [Deltaproteobacteria bacterium]
MPFQSIEFLSRVFESFGDPLVVYNKDYQILRVNQALLNLYQYDSQVLLGRRCYEVFHQRSVPCPECHIKEVFHRGLPQVRAKLITLPDGRQHHFEINSYPVKNGQGETIQVLEHGRDITARRHVEQTLAHRTQELQKTQSQMEMLFEVSRQVGATDSLKDLLDSLQAVTQKIVPDADFLCFILTAGGHKFLTLEGCSPRLGEPLRAALKKLERAGLLSDFVRYLDHLPDPQLLTSASGSNPPAFIQVISKDYASWFGLPISPQEHGLGYFFLGARDPREFSQTDLHFFQALVAQIAGHLRALVLHEEEIQYLRQQVAEKTSHGEIIGQSKKMQDVYELIDLVSSSDATVLITGENGTGKEMVAQAIHQQSHRRRGPFVVANCSAYSPTLLESELFGHEKGAFTGAIRRKKGRMERAHGGTLFLDEIGDISAATQILLLRFLQDHTFERVGGEESIEADVRVLAATNKDLYGEVESGRFRNDLYYRLNVITIHLPPLRERKEDIPLLAQHFLKKFSAKEGRKVAKFSSNAMQALMDYEWPGNVRQLENAVSHAVILTQGEVIRRRHLPRFLKEASDVSASPSLSDNERRLILRVLTEANWNKHDAARRLQVSRSTLYSKMRRYGLEKPK